MKKTPPPSKDDIEKLIQDKLHAKLEGSKKSTRTTLTMRKDQHKRLKVWAAENEMVFKDAIEHIFDKFLASVEKSFIAKKMKNISSKKNQSESEIESS